MLHERQLVLNAVLHQLSRAPSCPLGEVSRELCVSRRTIEKAISITTGKTFRDLREQMLVERVKSLLESHPTRTIKEVSFDLGYKSPRSFARAIKRACGSSPAQLRSHIIYHLLQAQKRSVSP
jgi:AraC-like DNA-binding protein